MTDHTHDPRTEEEQHLARTCAAKTSAAAAHLVVSGAMTPHAAASAFISAGVGTSLTAFGPGLTVEWLRDVADTIEAEHLRGMKMN